VAQAKLTVSERCRAGENEWNGVYVADYGSVLEVKDGGCEAVGNWGHGVVGGVEAGESL
jgi:hypothetical protein